MCAARDLRPYMFMQGPGMVDLAQTFIDLGSAAAKHGHHLRAELVIPSSVTISREVRLQAEKARQSLKDRLKQVRLTSVWGFGYCCYC